MTFTASSTTSQIEFADATPKDKNPGSDCGQRVAGGRPDVITASSSNIPDQTTGVSFTAQWRHSPTAIQAAPTTDFTANIQWGDGGTSTGTISQSGSTYTVTGTYSYAAHGTYTPEVDISSVAGGTASVADSVSVADNVTGCTGDGCSGTVTHLRRDSAGRLDIDDGHHRHLGRPG